MSYLLFAQFGHLRGASIWQHYEWKRYLTDQFLLLKTTDLTILSEYIVM